MYVYMKLTLFYSFYLVCTVRDNVIKQKKLK